MSPPVMNVFSPLMTHSSPSRTAVVRMLRASEPAPGSVIAKQLCRSPSIVGSQVALLLLVVGVEQDVVGVAAELELHERAAELDLDQRVHHRAEAHPAVLLGRLDAEEAGLPGLVLQRRAAPRG